MTAMDVLLNRVGESVHAGQAHFTRRSGRRADRSGIPVINEMARYGLMG